MTDTVTSSHDRFDGEGFSSRVGLLQAPSSGPESSRKRGEAQKVYFGTYRRWRNVQSQFGLMRVCRIFAFPVRSPREAFPKRGAGGQRLLANRSSWSSSLRSMEAGQVHSSSFCSHRRAPFTD
jgi:hypothetical protein